MGKKSLFDDEKNKKKDKKQKKEKTLLEEFDDIEDYAPAIPIASYRPQKEAKSTYEQMEEANEMGDQWLRTISNFKQEPIKSKKNVTTDRIFDFMGNGKKGKKKKKKKEEMKDYAVEFEPEMNLMQNLLSDQVQFTQSLQRRYNVLDSAKSSARGVGKYTTDLINSINQARSTSLQYVDKMASLKKTIAELNMKERKENAAHNSIEGEDIENFSANFLRKMIQQNREDAYLYGDDSPMEGSADDILENIDLGLEGSERSEDIDKYLKYENRNVEFIAVVDPDDESKYELQAYADDGERIMDYPIPQISRLDINRSTGLASDEYHTKYKVQYGKVI